MDSPAEDAEARRGGTLCLCGSAGIEDFGVRAAANVEITAFQMRSLVKILPDGEKLHC